MPCTSPNAPSAVCAMLIPSAALRSATAYERICDFIPSEMARPAASSAAELTRKPLDSLAKLLISAFWLPASRPWASSDEMLVWILIAMGNELLLGDCYRERNALVAGLVGLSKFMNGGYRRGLRRKAR